MYLSMENHRLIIWLNWEVSICRHQASICQLGIILHAQRKTKTIQTIIYKEEGMSAEVLPLFKLYWTLIRIKKVMIGNVLWNWKLKIQFQIFLHLINVCQNPWHLINKSLNIEIEREKGNGESERERHESISEIF